MVQYSGESFLGEKYDVDTIPHKYNKIASPNNSIPSARFKDLERRFHTNMIEYIAWGQGSLVSSNINQVQSYCPSLHAK